MKKTLFLIPMVVLLAVGCSDDAKVVEKEPVVDVVEQDGEVEESVTVEEEAAKEEETVEKDAPENKPKEESKVDVPAADKWQDGEPMDDISDEPSINPAEKVGYITKIEKIGTEIQLTVDFAELIIDDSHEVGIYVQNKEVGKDTVLVGYDVQVFSLNGTKLSVSSIEKLAEKKGILIAFLFNDAGKVFMIEEKYLP